MAVKWVFDGHIYPFRRLIHIDLKPIVYFFVFSITERFIKMAKHSNLLSQASWIGGRFELLQ